MATIKDLIEASHRGMTTEFGIIDWFLVPKVCNWLDVYTIDPNGIAEPIVLISKPDESKFNNLLEKWSKQGYVFGIMIGK